MTKPPRKPLLEMRKVSKIYGTGRTAVRALADVDLAIGAGEVVTIIGPSGSGKSTCLNILGCLDTPTHGRFLLDGQCVGALGKEARACLRRDAIGFVFQGSNLVPRMSALANVELPLVYRGVPRSERLVRARAALEAVGLGHRLDHSPAELSGGQQQRVAIARAIVSAPRVLIADEPTGALDIRTGRSVLALLGELNRALGVSIIMVTHDASVADFAPRRVVFRDGRLVSDETRARERHVA